MYLDNSTATERLLPDHLITDGKAFIIL
jgi:hypothetical protein